MPRARRSPRHDPARSKWREQDDLWRAIEGAVVDAIRNHPDYLTDKGLREMPRSVTKRVMGSIQSVLRAPAREGRG